MKVRCAFSGIIFTLPNLPGFVSEACDWVHPAMHLPLSKIAQTVSLFEQSPDRLSPDQLTLTFAAILAASDKIKFERPIAPNSAPTIACCLTRTFNVINQILSLPIARRDSDIPKFVITGDITNFPALLTLWEEALINIDQSEFEMRKIAQIQSAETRISLLNKSDDKTKRRRIAAIADWACLVAEFPTFPTISPITGATIPLAEYWKQIIRDSATFEGILSHRRVDVEELLRHLYEKVPVGTTCSHELFGMMEEIISNRDTYMAYGVENINSISKAAVRVILEESISKTREYDISEQNRILQSAPAEMPKESDYPNKQAFLKAKLAFNVRAQSTK